jgi:hypothetical protein
VKTRLKLGIVQKTHCNTCGIHTPHTLENSSLYGKYVEKYEGTGFETVVWWEEYEYRFWICQVCETAALEVSYSDMSIDGALDEYGKNGVSTWYPPPAKLTPKKFQRFRKRPLRNIYFEIIDSYNSGLKLVCAFGLRALLEGICADMGIEDTGETRPLTGKLYALAKRGLVKQEIVDNLFALKFIGDEAIHQLKTPAEEELETGVRVIENLISFLYKETEHQLSSQARALAKKRPDEVEEQKQKRRRRS